MTESGQASPARPYRGEADNCASCRYFEVSPHDARAGSCKRRSPVRLEDFVSAFPVMEGTDHCWEFDPLLRECCGVRLGYRHENTCEHFIGPPRPLECGFCWQFVGQPHRVECDVQWGRAPLLVGETLPPRKDRDAS